VPLEFTEAAANKVKTLIADEDNPDLKLRVYITGGGCSGFQYGFTFDDQVNDGDMTIEKQGVALVVDPMSLQYLVGGAVDYTEGLEGSRFVVTNPNATSTCVWVFVQHFSLKTVTLGLPFCFYLPLSSSANVGSFRCQRIAAKRITSVTTIPSIAEFSSGMQRCNTRWRGQFRQQYRPLRRFQYAGSSGLHVPECRE
jgi:iron-sulfur cluster insertion protein